MEAIKKQPIYNFINGEYLLPSMRHQAQDLHSPLNGSYLGTLFYSTTEDIEKAIQAAKNAFPAWSQKTLKERVQIFFRFRRLLEINKEPLSLLIQKENGKTREEAQAEVDKAIELCEFASALPQFVQNEVQEVSKGVECILKHEPLGIVASIVPFNFPLMVPMWTIPNAIALGNCMLLKPSEKVPLTMIRIAELLDQAGLPKGVFNIVQGSKEVAEILCEHKDIKAISFVGSTPIAKEVYRKATYNYKRCLALGGAKNHLIVLPDADIEMTASNIAASMSGCAGQRCMAASVLLAVDNINPIIEQLCKEVQKIIPGENLGAIISLEAKNRIENAITAAEKAGAKILVDGRNTLVKGAENGYYIAPTIIDHVTPDMDIAKTEIFGPVIAIIHTKSLEEAINIENANPYGNAAAIFTQNGAAANYVMQYANAGMIGINVGVPVPREPFSFGGWNESKFGSHDITGKSSIAFWTQLKKITTKWNAQARTNWMS